MKKIILGIFVISSLYSVDFDNNIQLPGLEDEDMGTKIEKKYSKNLIEKESPLNIRKIIRKGYEFEIQGIAKKNGKNEKIKILLKSTPIINNKAKKEVKLISKEDKKTSMDTLEIDYDEKLNKVKIKDESYINGELVSSVFCNLDSIPRKIPIKVLPGYKTPTETLICEDGAVVENVIKVDYAEGMSNYLIEETTITKNKDVQKIIVKLKILEGRILDAEYYFKNKEYEIKSLMKK